MAVSGDKIAVVCLVVFMVSVVEPASGFQCKIEPLKTRYEGASSVIVAKVLRCSTRRFFKGDTCSSNRWDIQTLEVLKGAASPRVVSSYPDILFGSAQLEADATLLLFLNENEQFGGCNRPIRLDTDNPYDTRQHAARVIREYRDGIYGDMSEPWVFHGSEHHCELRHETRREHASFFYFEEDSSLRQERDATLISGPGLMAGRLLFLVEFPGKTLVAHGETFEHLLTTWIALMMDGTEQPLELRLDFGHQWYPARVLHQYRYFYEIRESGMLKGASAINLFRKMLHTPDIDVLIQKPSYQRPSSTRFLTTRFKTGAEKFGNCLAEKLAAVPVIATR